MIIKRYQREKRKSSRRDERKSNERDERKRRKRNTKIDGKEREMKKEWIKEKI